MTAKELREMVAVMRELGVLECDGIKLGPAPVKAPAASQKDPQPRRTAHDTMFAATRIRPLEVKGG
jgi:hypothetical protein